VREIDAINAGKTGVSPDEQRRRSASTIPLGRYGDPDEFPPRANAPYPPIEIAFPDLTPYAAGNDRTPYVWTFVGEQPGDSVRDGVFVRPISDLASATFERSMATWASAAYGAPALAGLASRLARHEAEGPALLLCAEAELDEWGLLVGALFRGTNLRLEVARGPARAARQLQSGVVDLLIAPPRAMAALAARGTLKGERLILVTQQKDATRSQFIAFARERGASNLAAPILGSRATPRRGPTRCAPARRARWRVRPARGAGARAARGSM
jgi:hypothetical protein